MSYTNGGQTIDKSMNGIISYDTGGGVVIEGDTITATGVISDNITCETLEVNTSATFNGTASFDTALPTSVITSTTSDDQFITKAIGDTLYAGGGILSSNNTWTGQNYYNTILPTSTLTGTPTATQIAPVAMLNNLYARLASTNFFTGSNSFSAGLSASYLQTLFFSWSQFSGDIVEQTFDTVTGIFKTISYNNGTSARFDFGFFTTVIPVVEVIKFRIQETVSTFFTRVQVTTPDTANTNSTALSLTNSNATPNSLNMSLSWNGGVNGIIQAGDTAIIARTVIDSATTALTLATWSSTNCGVRITKDDVTLQGLTNNFSATTTNITGATNFTSLPSTTTAFTTATSNQFITKNIGDTLYTASGGFARLTTVDNAFTNNNTFVNLPSTTTTFTTATANQFITKNIGDTSYLSAVTGGFARLTTVDNTFTNSNSFTGTNAIINATNNIIRSKITADTATPSLIIENSTSTKQLKFIANASVDALNPLVRVNDAVISGGTGLCLVTDNTIDCGVRVSSTNVVMAGTGVIMVGTNNIAEALVTTATADPTFRIRGSGGDTKTIKFIANSLVNALNPVVEDGDGVISADTTLCLTADGATEVGIRILDTGIINIRGSTINMNAGTLNLSASTNFNSGIFVPAGQTFTCNGSGTIAGTFNFNALPFINVDATGADLDEAMNWRTTIAQINLRITNLKAAINSWSASNTFLSALDLRLPFIYNFAAATPYTNIGNLGYRITSTTRLTPNNSGTPNTFVNCVTLNMPATFGLWQYELSVRFTGAVSGRYGIAFGSTTTTQIPESITDMCTTVAGDYWIKTIFMVRNTVINQPLHGFMRSSVATSPINQVDMRLCRIA